MKKMIITTGFRFESKFYPAGKDPVELGGAPALFALHQGFGVEAEAEAEAAAKAEAEAAAKAAAEAKAKAEAEAKAKAKLAAENKAKPGAPENK